MGISKIEFWSRLKHEFVRNIAYLGGPRQIRWIRERHPDMYLQGK